MASRLVAKDGAVTLAMIFLGDSVVACTAVVGRLCWRITGVGRIRSSCAAGAIANYVGS